MTTMPKAAARPKSDGYCTDWKISVGMVRMPRVAASANGTSNRPGTGDEHHQRADSSDGISSGIVTWRSVYQNEAPCTRAASSSAASICRIGAMTKR